MTIKSPRPALDHSATLYRADCSCPRCAHLTKTVGTRPELYRDRLAG